MQTNLKLILNQLYLLYVQAGLSVTDRLPFINLPCQFLSLLTRIRPNVIQSETTRGGFPAKQRFNRSQNKLKIEICFKRSAKHSNKYIESKLWL